LEGGCQVPIGVNTAIVNGTLTMKGMVASIDGLRLIKDEVSGAADQFEQLGLELADKLRGLGAKEILDEIFATVRPVA
jgi:hydroxymethylbilane synthase